MFEPIKYFRYGINWFKEKTKKKMCTTLYKLLRHGKSPFLKMPQSSSPFLNQIYNNNAKKVTMAKINEIKLIISLIL